MSDSWIGGSIDDWLRRTTPPIIHREKLKRNHPDDFITVGDIEEAVKRATSWVKRNLREWPHEHRLNHRIEGDELLFWFEREY